MTWQIKYIESIKKTVRKLDPQHQRRLRAFLEDRVAHLNDPRSLGKALKGDGQIWRYRVGNYRILCEIQDKEITILIIDIGHRSKIYELGSQKY